MERWRLAVMNVFYLYYIYMYIIIQFLCETLFTDQFHSKELRTHFTPQLLANISEKFIF